MAREDKRYLVIPYLDKDKNYVSAFKIMDSNEVEYKECVIKYGDNHLPRGYTRADLDSLERLDHIVS